MYVFKLFNDVADVEHSWVQSTPWSLQTVWSLVRCSQVKLPNKNQDFSIVHLLTLKNASFVVLTNSKELLFYQKVGLVRQMWSSSISFKCFEECTHAAIFLNVQLQQLHSWHCFNLLDAVVFYVISILCSWFIRVLNIKKMKKFW